MSRPLPKMNATVRKAVGKLTVAEREAFFLWAAEAVLPPKDFAAQVAWLRRSQDVAEG